jgi:hypothetical protein
MIKSNIRDFLKHIIIFYVNYLVYIKIYRIFAIRFL